MQNSTQKSTSISDERKLACSGRPRTSRGGRTGCMCAVF
jgi:hypothetical protein